jgi:hypothetical protein
VLPTVLPSASAVAGSRRPGDRTGRPSAAGAGMRLAVDRTDPAAPDGRRELKAALVGQLGQAAVLSARLAAAGVRRVLLAVVEARGVRPEVAERDGVAAPAWLRARLLLAESVAFVPTRRRLSSPIPRQRMLRCESLLRGV